MKREKSGRIWLIGKSVYTNHRDVWNFIKEKLELQLHVGLEITQKQFLELIGDITVEYKIHGKTLIDEGEVLSKVKKFLTWKANKEKKGKIKEEQDKIDNNLKNQYNILESANFTISGKMNYINKHFKKKKLEGDIFEQEGTQFCLNVYSFIGPRIKKEQEGPKNRIIPFGPTDPDVIRFCTLNAVYMNPKKWNTTRDRFHELINDSNPKGFSYLLGVEKYLKKAVIEKPKFFRKVGPLWADFEAGCITKRDEVDEIIRDLEKDRFQLLIGDAASGKTVIASIIGYNLHKEGWGVSYLKPEIVQYASRKELQDDIDSFCINNEKSLIILEDLHRNASKIVELLEYIENSKTKFLITSRESYKAGLKSEKISFIKELCYEIRLEKKDFDKISSDIIETYKQNQKDERADELALFTLDDKYKIICEAKKNLWILAYLLEAWKSNIGINYNLVYKKVRKDIEDLIIEFRNKYDIRGVPEALLSIAPFSMLEVGVCESFLNEKDGRIKINPKILEKLVEYGEIQYETGYYSIPHSTLAQLYMETVLLIKGKKNLYLIKNIIKHQRNYRLSGGTNQYPLNMLHMYLQSMPTNYYQLMHRITSFERANIIYNLNRIFWPYKKWEPSRRELYYKFTITKNLLQNKQTMNSLIQLISEEKDLNEIFFLIQTIFFSSLEKKSKIFGEIINEDLCSKIEKAKTSDVNNLLYQINFIGAHSEKGTRALYKSQLKKINPSVMKEKLISEPHLFESCFLIYNLFCIDKRFIEYLKDIALDKIKKYLKMKPVNSIKIDNIFKPLIEALYESENIKKREIDKIDELLDSKMMVLHNFYD